MLLLELAIQGVRDLPAAQLKLNPNANAVAAQPLALQALARAIRSLLVGPSERAPVLLAPGAKMAQAAVTLMSHDHIIYRLGRDLVNGRARLSRHSRETNGFVSVTEDSIEATQLLRSSAGLCDGATFDQAFLFDCDQLPSHTPGPSSAPRMLAKAPAPDLQRRLSEIEAQLAAQSHTAAIEFELDGVQKRTFAIDDELRSLGDPDIAVKQAQENLARFAALPADFGEQYTLYRELVARRDENLKRWQVEQQRFDKVADNLPEPVGGHRWVWLSALAGVVGLLAGIGLGGRFRYLALLDIPAFGVVAAVLWQRLGRRDREVARERQSARSQERRDKITQRNAAAITAVESKLRELGLDTAPEVETLIDARKQAEETVRRAFAARAESAAGERRAQLLAQRQALGATIAGLEEQLVKAGSGIDMGAMRAEAAQLRGRIAGGSPAALPAAAVGDEFPGLRATIVRNACDLWSVAETVASERLAGLTANILAVITGGQLTSIELSARDALVRSADGREFRWGELARETRDTLYVALRLGLVAGCDERARMPAVIVDCAAPAWFAAVTQPQLAQGGQVLVLTDDPSRLEPNMPVTRLGT